MQITHSDDETPEVYVSHAPEATPAEDSATPDSPEPSEQATSTALDRKLAKENQSLRKRLRDLEAEQKARADAELSETERLQQRVNELTAQHEAMTRQSRDIALRADIAAAASKFGIVDVDAAARLLDASALEYDDTDGWIGVEDALRALTHERPWLVSTAPPVSGGANPTNPPRRRSSLTLDALKGMTDREIAALPPDEVDAVLSGRQ